MGSPESTVVAKPVHQLCAMAAGSRLTSRIRRFPVPKQPKGASIAARTPTEMNSPYPEAPRPRATATK